MLRYVLDVNIILILLNVQGQQFLERARQWYAFSLKNKVSFYAPQFLLIELLNVLVKRHKFTYREVKKALRLVNTMGIHFELITQEHINEITKMVFSYGLTSYDAQYLYVAKKWDCSLITTDEELLKAGRWTIHIKDIQTITAN